MGCKRSLMETERNLYLFFKLLFDFLRDHHHSFKKNQGVNGFIFSPDFEMEMGT